MQGKNNLIRIKYHVLKEQFKSTKAREVNKPLFGRLNISSQTWTNNSIMVDWSYVVSRPVMQLFMHEILLKYSSVQLKDIFSKFKDCPVQLPS